MITLRPSTERGHFNYGWLDTYHTFSFSDYFDKQHMNFRSLRVINEDRVAPGQGFGTHGHRDMEIITVVLEGALQHKDSMGNGSLIRPGDVQRMSAGTGVTHSEFNPSPNEPVHLLQIWILPERAGLTPSYEQKTFSEKNKADQFCLIASGKTQESVVKIHQDVDLYLSDISKGKLLEYKLKTGRHAWIQVARGSVVVEDSTRLAAGDGAAVSKEARVRIKAESPAEILLFDLA